MDIELRQAPVESQSHATLNEYLPEQERRKLLIDILRDFEMTENWNHRLIDWLRLAETGGFLVCHDDRQEEDVKAKGELWGGRIAKAQGWISGGSKARGSIDAARRVINWSIMQSLGILCWIKVEEEFKNKDDRRDSVGQRYEQGIVGPKINEKHYSFIHSFTHSFIYAFIISFMDLIVRVWIHSFIWSTNSMNPIIDRIIISNKTGFSTSLW